MPAKVVSISDKLRGSFGIFNNPDAISEVEPETAEEIFRKARQAYLDGFVLDALDLFLSVLVLSPNHLEALVYLGMIHCNKTLPGSNGKAVAFLRRAVLEHSNSAKAHFWLGMALQDSKEFKSAIFHFENSIRLEPWYAMTHYHLGFLYKDSGIPLEAYKHFWAYSSMDPRSVYGERARYQMKVLASQVITIRRPFNYTLQATF